VNCFITTGYDTIEVVRGINDQNLNEMEEFINKHFPKNVRYIHPDFDIFKVLKTVTFSDSMFNSFLK